MDRAVMSAVGYYPEGPLDPVAEQVAAYFSAVPLTAYPLDQTRAGMETACILTQQPGMREVQDHQIPVSGGEITVRAYQPFQEASAVLMWMHGGGFVFGSLNQLDNFCRLLADKTGQIIVSVDYRLAPEHPFPTPLQDVEAVALWLSTHMTRLFGRKLPLWMGGDSAGANLATVATRRLMSAGHLAIAGNILAYPCTDSPLAVSLTRFQPPFLSVADAKWMIDHYLADDSLYLHPDFAPLHAEGLGVLPPTMVITAEHDILTEQAESYAERLREEGVTVELFRVPGMIHGFLTIDAFFEGAAGETIEWITTFIRERPARKEAV